jgi:adenylyl-sulfate kinase
MNEFTFDDQDNLSKSPNTILRDLNIPRSEREKQNGHKAVVLWLTGLSGAGKSTIAGGLEKKLFARNYKTVLLDGDDLRHGICSDLDFSPEDRKENIRRAGEVAKIFFENGNIVFCAFISPFKQDRAIVRGLFPQGRFIEIYVSCNIDECVRRDPNGLYKKALSGIIKDFTGINSPYEKPDNPEIILDTQSMKSEECVDLIENFLITHSIVPH